MVHFHQRGSICLDTGILQIIYTATKQYSRSLVKLNQLSPIRHSEDIMICVRWELSFSQPLFKKKKKKTQTNLQLCIIAGAGCLQLSRLRPSWVFIKAPVCRRALISEETRALGTGAYSSLMPAWS